MSDMFAKKIKHARKLLKLTMEEVATNIGTCKSYVWELENKEQARPSAELVFKLSKLFGCSMEYFINDKYKIGTYPDIKNNCLKCAKIKNILEGK